LSAAYFGYLVASLQFMPSKMLALRLELVSDPPLLSWLVLHGEFLYLGTYVDLLTFESKLDWIGLQVLV
jgi:hypothetical protein